MEGNLTPTRTPEEMTEILCRRFPREAIRQRAGGGGKRLDYVEGHTVIHRLIEATGNRFSVEILGLESRQVGTDAQLLTATVRLTIPGLGSREHIGVQLVNNRGGEDLVKGAITDALKKAATLFGVGLELYGEDYEGSIAADSEPEFHVPPARQSRAAREPQQARPPRPAPPPPRPQPKQPSTADETVVTNWTEFWHWARGKGFSRKSEVEQLTGMTVPGIEPAVMQAAVIEALKRRGQGTTHAQPDEFDDLDI